MVCNQHAAAFQYFCKFAVDGTAEPKFAPPVGQPVSPTMKGFSKPIALREFAIAVWSSVSFLRIRGVRGGNVSTFSLPRAWSTVAPSQYGNPFIRTTSQAFTTGLLAGSTQAVHVSAVPTGTLDNLSETWTIFLTSTPAPRSVSVPFARETNRESAGRTDL